MMNELITERLILREFTGTDWPAIHEIFSNPDVARYVYPINEAQCRDWVTDKLKQQYNREPIPVSRAVVLRKENRLIGYVQLARPMNVGKGAPGELALDYALHRSFWGHGYMTEAVRRMIRFAFETLDAPQVVATCETTNVASARVMEKAGMVYAATFMKWERDLSETPHHRYEIDKARYEAEVAHGSFLD